MKKLNITFALLFLFASLMAPPDGRATLYIEYTDPITDPRWASYEPLVDAIYHWESHCNPLAYNPKENAVGGFQIRQIRLDDYNKRMGTDHTLEDCYDYEFSKNMFLYYAEGKSYEQAAKSWNGSGPMTIAYWEGVKRLLL